MHVIFVIDTVHEDTLVAPIEERLGVKTLATVIMYFEGNDIDGYNEMMSTLAGRINTILHQKSLILI